MEVPEGPGPPPAQQIAGGFGLARRADPKEIARADDLRQLRKAVGLSGSVRVCFGSRLCKNSYIGEMWKIQFSNTVSSHMCAA
jgi:hypothetical protein